MPLSHQTGCFTPSTSQQASPAPLLLLFLLLGVGLSKPVTQRQSRHGTVLGNVPSWGPSAWS